MAIWRQVDNSLQAGWTVTANGGTAEHSGDPGTIVWGILSPSYDGSLMMVK
jgi:hypothetical protein